jgi:hypothetical protein
VRYYSPIGQSQRCVKSSADRLALSLTFSKVISPKKTPDDEIVASGQTSSITTGAAIAAPVYL